MLYLQIVVRQGGRRISDVVVWEVRYLDGDRPDYREVAQSSERLLAVPPCSPDSSGLSLSLFGFFSGSARRILAASMGDISTS